MMRYPEGHWAPVVIETLIHLHVYPTPLHESASTEMAIRTLEAGKLIEPCEKTANQPDGYRLTDRGRAHLLHLCQIPYPMTVDGGQTWFCEVTTREYIEAES